MYFGKIKGVNMNKSNVIEQDSSKEIESLKRQLYTSKRNRLDMIDGFIKKISTELDTRNLKEIPTPVLSRMLISFADLAKKEQPVIELTYSEKNDPYDDFYKKERVTF